MARAQPGGVLGDLHTLFSTGTVGGLADVQLVERFAARGDEAAFAALVARHGPMVLAVCRGVLRRPHDVEDAFQATFLIFARKAGTLRRRESLGGWLHQVARRVALQAATEAARHRAGEARAGVPEAEEPSLQRPWDDVVPLLHEELARLPEKYRAPIVLCELESLTRDEAARQLGWPPGTVAGRLARGIALLRSRLSRRGVGSAAVAASLPAAREAGAAVPASWVTSAFEVAAGTTPARSVEVLVEEALRAMIRSEIRRIAMITLTLGITLAVMAVALVWAREEEAEVRPTMPVMGLVVDPDGRPAAGVAVFGSVTRSKLGNWGQVVAEARTDGQGRFQLAIPTDPVRPGPKPGAIWAYQPGRLVASYAVLRGNVHGDVPVRLALGPPATTLVEVRDPGGKPVAGATIMPRVLNRGFLSVPDGLAGRIAADSVTDDRGRATIAAFLPEEVRTVIVTAKGFGTQQFGFGLGGDVDLGTKVVNLMPTGRVEGRVVREPETIRDVALTVISWNTRSNPPPPPALGLFTVTTDDEGRFVLPEVPVGTLNISGGKEKGGLYVTSPAGLKVEAGETTRVELKPTPGVRVYGVVREKGSSKPIPGVKVGDFSGGEVGESDRSGRFRFSTRPGRDLLQILSTPAGYAGLMYGLPDVTVPQDAAEFEFPPIELTRAGALRGVVHNDRGRPVPGATVAASWQVDEGAQRQGRREVSVTTDGRGAFSVADVPLVAAVTLSATAPDAGRTAQPVTARPGGEGEPVTLTLDPERLVAMKGRVVDTMGKPLAGARVHLRRQDRHESGQVKGDVPVDFAGVYVLRTDAKGRFETPRGLDAEGEYAAIAEADGYGPGRTPWTRAAERAFPDLTIGPEGLVQVKVGTLEGLVRDGSGRPVTGASAWASFPGGPVSPGKVTTDAQGRFQLIGLPPTRALVFVEAEGFRFQGVMAGHDNSPVKVILTRINEPAAGMRTLAPPLPRADELVLARGVIGPFAERVMKEKGADDSTTFRTLTVLAAVDPARVLEAVAAKPFKEGWFNDRLRSDAALALLADGPDEALAVAESIELAYMRSSAFAELTDRLPGDDRAGKLRLLDRAVLAARAVPEPGHKMVGVARVAEHWIDLGETDRATKLLREFEPVARQLSTKGWDAYARGNFAEELAQIDPAAALELIEGLGEGEATDPDRHRLNIAQELAGRDPAAAERVLDGLRHPSSIVRHGPRIVHAMAPKDPARARRIADRMDAFPDDVRTFPFHHAYALGMMALALADTDKAAAEALLEESYRDLAGLAKEGKRAFQDTEDAAVVAAALLPVAERIDPSLVPEYFWRAASWRGTAPATSRSKTMPDAVLALLLARYDRDVARAILEPLVSEGLSKPGADAYHSLRAMAAIDPRRAVTLLDTIPDDPDAGLNPFRNPKNEARLGLAGALAARPEDRWERVVEKLLLLWTVGREDIF